MPPKTAMRSPFASKSKPAPPSGAHMNPFSKAPEPKSPKILDSIRAKRSANGGFEMQHQFSGFDHEPEIHQAPDGAGMLHHMAQHMGVKGVNIAKAAEERSEPPAERAREAATPGAETAEEAGGEY